MLNVTNYQGNTNQNHNEPSLHTWHDAIIKKKKKCSKCWYNDEATMEKVWKISQKWKLELSHDPAIPLLGIYAKELK